MKLFRLLMALLCLGLASPALAQKLTNSDVVKMVEGGVPPPFIVATIERMETDFNLGPDALIELKKRGVPDGVLEAMMRKAIAAAPKTSSAPSSTTPAPAGDWASRERGVYLEVEAGRVVMLTEAKITGIKVGGGLGSALTYGIKKMTSKYQIRDAAAGARAPAGRAVLYIVKLDPRDLVLLKVSKKGSGREFESGKMGGFSSNTMEAVKGDFAFTTEEVVPGVYRVIMAKPLAPGEYGFGVVNMTGISPLYDFGIDR